MLLAVVLTWGSARASHTINVMQNSAVAGGVYIYAWDQNDKPLTDAWPGTRLTATTTVQGVTWYTMTFTGATTVKFKLNLGGTTAEADASSTPDPTATKFIMSRSGGHYYYEYDPSKYGSTEKADNLTDYYDLPAGVTYSPSDNCVYFLNVKGWTQVYCHFWRVSDDAGTSWPGVPMTKVGTNSNGWDIYKWTDPNPSGAVDKKFIIHDNKAANDNDRDHRSPEFVYTHNDVISGYNYTKLCNVSSERSGDVIYNTPNYFSDANMRAALEAALGVEASATNVTNAENAIAAKSVKVLDISNHNISSFSGINQFVNLEELYAADNSLGTGSSNDIDLTPCTNLRILDLSGNTNLTGCTNSHHPYVNISTCFNLEELNLANTSSVYLGGLATATGSTNYTKLKKLNIHNVGMDYLSSSTWAKMPNLEWVDLSDNKLTSTALGSNYFNNCPNIKYLDISGNTNLYNLYLTNKTKLEYLNMSGCTAFDYSSQITICTKLTYLNLNNNTAFHSNWMTYLNKTNHPSLRYLNLGGTTGKTNSYKTWSIDFPALDSLIFTGNTTATSISLTNDSEIDVLDITGCTNLATLNVTNCNLTNLTPIVGASGATKLTTVDVSNNSLTTLNGVEVFPALTALVAKNNAFTTLTYTGHTVPQKIELSNNTLMTSANLSGNRIQKAAFMGCTNLQTLDISNNQIEEFCANWQDNISSYSNWTGTGKYLYVAELSNLETLDISGNNISTLGTNADNGKNSLRGLTSLSTLNAANNAIYSISTPVSTSYSSLQPLTALENLDLSNNSKHSSGGFHLLRTNGLPLKNVNLQGNTNLDEITIYNGELTDINFGISTGISGLSKLAKLDVTGNKLVNVTVPRTPNTLLSIDMSNNALLQSVVANHDVDGSNSKLRYIEVDGCPLLTNFTMTGCDLFYATQANTLNATNNPALVTLNLSDNAIASADITLNGYQNLTSVDLSDNTIWAHGLTITNCPALTTIDVENNTAMTKVEANNGGYTNSSYPLVKTTSGMNLALYFNQNNFNAIPSVTAGVKYLYLQENAFAQDLTLNGDAISLKGISLSNKSTVAPIKKFTASVAQTTPDQWAINYSLTPPAIVQTNASAADGSNTVLEAINLAGNNALDSVKVNGFKAITKLASATDMTTDAGKGIYVKGLSSLKKLDISGNRIVLIGQDGSLSGLSGLEQLDASHNVIRTLANRTARGTSGNANYRAAYGNGKYTAATCPNIEDLTGLKRLNLSHNHLCDSIHLETNHALEWLDVSCNRFINDRTDAVDVGPLYYLDSQDGVIKQWKETAWKVRRDAFTGDANDTIGLRMLDLYRQTNLRYLNISETYIENTATSRIYVANRQGPLTLTTKTQADHEGHTVGRWGVPRFVLINHCALLDTLICNYNGMKSLGIGSAPQASNSSNGGQITGCPNLKYLEAKEMRGQDPAIMQGELRVSARNPLMEHYDVSGSNFDYIGLADGATGEHLRYINVSGNYQSQNTYTDNGNGTWTTTYTDRNGGTHSYTVHGNPYQLNLSALPVLDSLVSVNTPHLQVMSAHNMPEFNYMEITQDPNNNDLRELYLHHNATMNDVIGLETLNHLEVYQINDSHFTGTLEMPAAATATLRDLRVSNEALSYAASRNNLTSVPLGSFNALERVDVQNNPAIAALDINSNSAAKLAHLDFANCHLDNDGFTGRGINQLTALEYLDCSNDDTNAPNGTVGNWLTDLDLTAASGLTTLKAANNELYKLAVSPSQAMAVLDFHNNHVNGIDLTGVTVTNYNCANNGRKVKANAQAKPNGDVLYYFQLDANAAGDKAGGNFVGDEQSDMYIHTGSKRMLRADGFDATKVSFDHMISHQDASGAPRLKDAISADDIDPTKVYGTIAVLEPAASGDSRASYGYDEGNANLTTEFYLDWDANAAVVTAIDDINGNVGEVSLRPGVGGMEVVGPAGQTFGVYDMAGRLVQQVTTDQTGRATIDGLTPGIYVVAGEKAQVR